MKSKILLFVAILVGAGGSAKPGEIRGVCAFSSLSPTSRQEVGIAELNGHVYVIGDW